MTKMLLFFLNLFARPAATYFLLISARSTVSPRPGSTFWLFHMITLFTVHCSTRVHINSARAHLPSSSLNLALASSPSEVSCLLANLASFRPLHLWSFRRCRLSHQLTLRPTRRALPVSVPRCRARFFLSLTPAVFSRSVRWFRPGRAR